MSLKRILLPTALIAISATTFTACTRNEINCVLGGKKPDSCNLYQSDTSAANYDEDVIILGDSMWDYGEPHGAIPLELINLSGTVYFDLSRSGADGAYIREKEIPRIPGQDSNNMTVKTILISGGANDVREPCEINVPNEGDNTTVDTLTNDCIAGMVKASTAVELVLSELHKINSLEHIIWGGLIYFPSNEYSPAVIDSIVDGGISYLDENDQLRTLVGLKDRCENPTAQYDAPNKCYYTDLRFNAFDSFGNPLAESNYSLLWAEPDAETQAIEGEELCPGVQGSNTAGKYARCYLFDGTHVNVAGARKSAEQLWYMMENIGAYRLKTD